MTGTLSALSTVALYVAMGFYTAAFVVFSIDLARRGAEATTTVPSAVARRIAATQPPTTVVIGEESSEQSTKSKGAPSRAARGVTRWAFGLTIAGFAFHLIATVLRGVAAARVPWANMWEFSMTGTLVIVGVFLLANLKWDIKYRGGWCGRGCGCRADRNGRGGSGRRGR